MFSYCDLYVVRFAEMCRLERGVPFYEYVDHAHRDHCLSPCARYIRIDYSDNCLRTLDGCKCRVHGCSERYIAVLVRWADLDHRHIAWQCTATVEFLGLAQEYRYVVGVSGLHTLAYISAHKETLMEEYSVKFRVCIWSRTLCVKMVDSYVLQFSGSASFAQCVNEDSRSTCNAAQMYMVS